MPLDPKQWEAGQPYPPLGTMLAAAVLREAGYEVRLFDSQFSSVAEDVLPHFETFRPDVFVICDDSFNYLTKMCLTNMREAAFRMQEMAKQRGCTVIVNSSDATDHAAKYLEHGADFVIKGEVEAALLELMNALRDQQPVTAIAGLVFSQEGKTITNAPRQVMKALDELPLPAWDLVDMEKYRSVWKSHHGYFSLNVATTRGCPYKCNWCAKPIYGNRYNSRSPEQVVEELAMLKEKFRPDHIWFCDDIFGLKPGWLKLFAELVEAKKLQLRYKIQSRADLLLEEDNIDALARSGCKTVWMGAESGSQKILDAMDKGTKVEQIREATRLLKKRGIEAAFFLQFGYPGETIEDIRLTIALLNELLPEDIGISVSYPLPGTKFYERVKSELKDKQNWSDSDDLALMFRNTYSPGFYRQLHRYIHWNYRKHQGLASLKKLLRGKAKRSDVRRALLTAFYIPAAMAGHRRLKKTEHAWS